MSTAHVSMDDKRIERIVATLLRAGVMLSAAVVLIGGLMYLHQEHADLPQYHVFHSADAPFRNLRSILHSVWLGNSEAIIQTGILVLIVPPMFMSVGITVLAYKKRNRTNDEKESDKSGNDW